MDNNVVPVFLFFFLFGLPIIGLIVNRALSHNERMQMIRMGMQPPPDPRAFRRAARRGWNPDPAQMGMGNFQPGAYGYDPYFSAQRQLRKGITLAMVGLALLIGLSFIGYNNGSVRPGPWLLGGLIPLFIGIAQVIIAVLSGAVLGTPHTMTPPPGPTPQAPQGSPFTSAASGAPPPTGPPYGWRPGAAPELERPAQPPDYK
ncbi:MAG: hypothetical protein M3Y21_03805 [Candidatus Eremiobacteraeota bacterium]|nr:hypothetical protein [Candidatus Eremiobacteraeota bacterium]